MKVIKVNINDNLYTYYYNIHLPDKKVLIGRSSIDEKFNVNILYSKIIVDTDDYIEVDADNIFIYKCITKESNHIYKTKKIQGFKLLKIDDKYYIQLSQTEIHEIDKCLYDKLETKSREAVSVLEFDDYTIANNDTQEIIIIKNNNIAYVIYNYLYLDQDNNTILYYKKDCRVLKYINKQLCYLYTYKESEDDFIFAGVLKSIPDIFNKINTENEVTTMDENTTVGKED